MTTIPEFTYHIPRQMGKQILINGQVRENTMSISEYENRSKKMNNILYRVAHHCNATVLDIRDTLCKNDECISQIGGHPIYRDGDHLSEFGNKLLKPMFASILNKKEQ